MESKDIAVHYSNLAKNYNSVVYTSSTDKGNKLLLIGYLVGRLCSEYQDKVTRLMVRYLDLTTSSQVVDLGAGVCTMAANIAKIAELDKSVLCVDPSKEMLEIGKSLDKIETLNMSAEEWIQLDKDQQVRSKFLCS